ncbi:hypothetical protein CEXT_550241 [Caerostris extrusa]|uniref:Uncharacterized protein n=1 Tax=Caerostris extrusa TaxID=172846 RepID=A0AAV4MJ04_CAEEX|nr:hypothetical protein CEXT_550241 [Caerostris extrusa]
MFPALHHCKRTQEQTHKPFLKTELTTLLKELESVLKQIFLAHFHLCARYSLCDHNGDTEDGHDEGIVTDPPPLFEEGLSPSQTIPDARPTRVTSGRGVPPSPADDRTTGGSNLSILRRRQVHRARSHLLEAPDGPVHAQGQTGWRGPVPEGTPEPPRAAPTNPAVTPTLAVVPSGKRLHQQTRRIFGRWWSIRLGKRVESSHIAAELVMESHSLMDVREEACVPVVKGQAAHAQWG